MGLANDATRDEEGRHYPERPIVGVGAVVWKNEHILLIKRGREPLKGQWSLPGGAQHLGETIEATAIREIAEECGINVIITGLVDVVDAIFTDGGGMIRNHYTLIDVMGEWQSGDAYAGSDATDIAWTKVEDIGRFSLSDKTLAVILKSAALRKPAL